MKQPRNNRSDHASVVRELCCIVQSSAGAVSTAMDMIAPVLKSVFPRSERRRIELGIEEVLQNGHEHGNLGISFTEKGEACNAGRWEDLLAERNANAERDGKKLSVKILLDDRVFSCTVTDQGRGFDWKVITAERATPDRLHGRGLLYVKQAFDEVQFNEIGNSVTLRKKLNR